MQQDGPFSADLSPLTQQVTDRKQQRQRVGTNHLDQRKETPKRRAQLAENKQQHATWLAFLIGGARDTK